MRTATPLFVTLMTPNWPAEPLTLVAFVLAAEDSP